MRIWIDGQCLQTASRERGIGRYLVGLLGGMAKRPELDLEISFNAALPDTLIAARALVAAWIPEERIHVWHGMAEAGEASLGYTARRQASEIALAHHVAMLAPDFALAPSLFEGFNDPATPFANGAATGSASALPLPALPPASSTTSSRTAFPTASCRRRTCARPMTAVSRC